MIDQRLATELNGLLGTRGFLSAEASRADCADRQGRSPEAVLLPELPSEAAHALRLASGAGVQVVPRGAGTSWPQLAYAEGALVLGSRRLCRLWELDTENLTASVEPGLGLAAFQAAVEQQGLFFPPDPPNAATATLGGAAGVDARGPRALKYGSVKDYVLGLEALLADGTRLQTGANTVKNASGYDLTRLFVGARGTLCFYTRLRLRLLPLPAARETLVVSGDDLAGAIALAEAIMAAGLVPARLEALDCAAARLLGLDPGQAPRALLLCELDGSAPAVAAQTERVRRAVGNTEVDGLAGEQAAEVWSRLTGWPAVYTAEVPRPRMAAFFGGLSLLPTPPLGVSASLSAGRVRFLYGAGNSNHEAAAAATVAALRPLTAGLNGGQADGTAARLLATRLKAAFDPRGTLVPHMALTGATE
ncbi:MAG: FAD-binding oxidoreductase [Chloroflexota bacterium]